MCGSSRRLLDSSLKSAAGPKMFKRHRSFCCCFNILLLAYCFVFVSCLFTDPSKMQKERCCSETLSFEPPLSLRLPILVPSPHYKSLGSWPHLVRRPLLDYLAKRKFRVMYVLQNTNVITWTLGANHHSRQLPLAWLRMLHVPQLPAF